MVNGWHRFHSAMDNTKHIGFTRNGRAIRFANRPNRPYEQCYNFVKFDRTNIEETTVKRTTIASIIETSPTPNAFNVTTPTAKTRKANEMIKNSNKKQKNHAHRHHHQQYPHHPRHQHHTTTTTTTTTTTSTTTQATTTKTTTTTPAPQTSLAVKPVSAASSNGKKHGFRKQKKQRNRPVTQRSSLASKEPLPSAPRPLPLTTPRNPFHRRLSDTTQRRNESATEPNAIKKQKPNDLDDYSNDEYNKLADYVTKKSIFTRGVNKKVTNPIGHAELPVKLRHAHSRHNRQRNHLLAENT